MQKTAHKFFFINHKSPILNRGFTLIEVIISISIISFLSAVTIVSYRNQLDKGRDVVRKNDLKRIQVALESYEKDNECYPIAAKVTCGSTQLAPYLDKVPCDPETNQSYVYEPANASSCPRWYRIYATLKNTNDAFIKDRGCTPGCGLGYNYYALSPNAPMPAIGTTPVPSFTPAPTATPTPTSTSTPTAAGFPTSTPTPTPTLVNVALAYVSNVNGISSTSCVSPCSISTSSSVTSVSKALYLTTVAIGSSSVSVSSISGLCSTWTKQARRVNGIANSLEVWSCYNPTAASGVVRANLSGNVTYKDISVARFDGANLTSQLGVPVSAAFTTSTTTPSINLTTTANNSIAFGAFFTSTYTFTPWSGYTLITTAKSIATAGLGSEYKKVLSPAIVAVKATLGTANTISSVIAIEIKD